MNNVYQKSKPRGSADFRPGSNPSHKGVQMTQADSHDTTTNVVKFPGVSRTPEERDAKAALTLARAVAATSADPAFALIADKLAADIVYSAAIDAQDEADERGIGEDEADDDCLAAGDGAAEIEWKLANTPPTTLAGVAAVLRFANEIEDANLEWPNTDTIGREGWHYQLRAVMAAGIESIIQSAEAQS
jgi:hypothetical protein